MKTLVMIEVRGETLPPISRETVAGARQLGGEVIAVLMEGTDDHAAAIFSAGADTVIKNILPDQDPGARAEVLHELAVLHGADLVFLPHTIQGLDVAGELAVKMEARTFTDVVQVFDDRQSPGFARLVQGGRILIKEKPGFPLVVTIRPNTMDIVPYNGPEAILASEIIPPSRPLPVLDRVKNFRGRPQLRDAPIVIGVGAGIGGPETLSLVYELAEDLGAAVGATRSVVERGWMDDEYLIGSGGKFLSPFCYISLGASGSPGHLSAVVSARVIVAINSDPGAPIFQKATYGLIGQVHEVLPPMISRLKKIL